MSWIPYLVSALMAQESTFTAEIRSSANARGLMQVMPARAGCTRAGWAFGRSRRASLSQPETNVRIRIQALQGSRGQVRRHSLRAGELQRGEGRVAAWLKEYPDLPADEFIDSIRTRRRRTT
jgi:soluble lytic murein transglycosylase